MREIVVISGKGGTGKTSVTASLAHLSRNTIVCDLDVDAPDLHILLDPHTVEEHSFISGNEAIITPQLCTRCGSCFEYCRFDAVLASHQSDTSAEYKIDSIRCEGCGVCVALCPSKAIAFPEKECGQWYVSTTRFGTLIHAQLHPGEENSGRLVTLLKQQARQRAKAEGLDYILCDGSPGVGCPVISSLSGAHLAVTVVESTPSGRHDFERVAALCDHFRIPVAVIINKYDLNKDETQAITTLSKERGYTIVGDIPFDTTVTSAMIQRKAITETNTPLAQLFASMIEKIHALAATPPPKRLSL